MILHEDIINLGDKPYEFKEFFPMDSKFLEENIKLGDFHSTVAKYGGPIAIMRNKKKFMLNTRNKAYVDSICFFTSDGVMFNQVKLDYKDEVVCFDFLQNELLFILTNTPAYYLIDPFRKEQKLKPYNLDTKFTGNILQAKIFGNGVAFCTKSITQNQPEEIRFYYVDNVHTQARDKNTIQEKAFQKAGIKELPRDWIVMTKDQTELKTLEIQMTHPESGVISITETNRQVYYMIPEVQGQGQAPVQRQNQSLPPIKNIQFISLSPSNSLIAYLQQLFHFMQTMTYKQYLKIIKNINFTNIKFREVGGGRIKLSVLSNDYEAKRYTTCDVDLKGLKLPNTISSSSKESQLQMMWCGDDCCVLQIDQSLLMIGPDVTETIQLNEDFILSREYDGIRVITKKCDKMLRALPDSFLNAYPEYLFNNEETKPAAQLLQNYQNLRSKQPFDDSNLRSNQSQLREAVKDCMITAAFITEEDKQKDLLKAASYGKTYLGPDAINHDEFGLLCQKLRVVYNFRELSTKRMITCSQVNHLLSGDLQQQLINIMLRYDYHELAFNVCNQLDFKPKVRIQIFEHWAERVIENSSQSQRSSEYKGNSGLGGSGGGFQQNNLDLEDDRVAEKIINKLKGEKNVSFVNIAKRATKECRQNLAMKLLYQEPSAFKRVPVLIWMGKNCAEFETNALQQSGLERSEIHEKLKSKEWKEEVSMKQASHYENALSQALKSRDSELIYMCLKEMDTYMPNDQLKYHILKKNPVFANHYKNYLKNSINLKKQERYQEFLSHSSSDNGIEKICHYIKNSLNPNYAVSTTENLKNRQINFELALKELKTKGIEDVFLRDMLIKELTSLDNILKDTPKEKLNTHTIDEFLDWTINKSIQDAFLHNPSSAKEKIKHLEVTPKRTDFLKVRNLINQKEYDQLEYFLTKDVNKKNVIISYELVADMLIKAGAKENAVRLILNMPNIDERITILLKIDEAKRAVQDVLNQKKNQQELLKTIREQCKDPDILNYMDYQISQQGNKK